jgi:hypothetical protein
MAWPRFLSFGQSRRTWGMLLLGIWLIITGLQKFVNMPFGELDKILAGLAIAAGALIILDR